MSIDRLGAKPSAPSGASELGIGKQQEDRAAEVAKLRQELERLISSAAASGSAGGQQVARAAEAALADLKADGAGKASGGGAAGMAEKLDRLVQQVKDAVAEVAKQQATQRQAQDANLVQATSMQARYPMPG